MTDFQFVMEENFGLVKMRTQNALILVKILIDYHKVNNLYKYLIRSSMLYIIAPLLSILRKQIKISGSPSGLHKQTKK